MQAYKLKAFWRRKPIKITGYILIGLLLLIAILLSAASIYVYNNKQKIITLVKTEFHKRLNGDLSIGDIDLSVWKNFPNLTIDIKNVTVADSLYHKPLLKANDIYCAVSLFQLSSGKPDIARVKISGAQFHLFIDSTGFNNAYLLSSKNQPAVTDSFKTTPRPIIINHIELENFTFISEDKVKNKHFGVNVSTAVATIKRQDSLLLITLNEECLLDGLGFNLEKGVYVENSTIKAKWQMQFDKSAKTLIIQQSPAVINNNDFKISAEFHFGGDSAWFLVHAITDKILYKDAKALLTQKIRSKLTLIDVTMPIEVDAKLVGSLHGGDPHVHVVCKAKNNILITPIATFGDCNFTGIYENRVNDSLPPSDPNSIVYFPQFTGKWYSVPLIGDSTRIDNLSDPVLYFDFKTNCSFSQLDDAFNLQNISFDGGTAKLDLKYKGPLTANPSMLGNITGALHVEDGKLTYVPHNLQFINCQGDLEFLRNTINIKKITCDYLKNHFEVTGAGSSINRIAMVDSGKSSIVCNIFCPVFYAADFKKVFAKRATRQPKAETHKSIGSTIAGLDDILSKGNIALNINAKQLVLENFSAQNAKLSLLLQQDDWRVQHAALDFGGGSFTVDADIRQAEGNFLATAHCDIQNADVRNAFFAFNNFGQDGILYTNLRGTLNTSAVINMQMDNKGAIVPGTLQGNVNFSIRNGALINYTPILVIQDYAFKNRDLNNIDFAEIKNTLTVKQNQVIIPRMEIASSFMRLFVEGVYGVAKSPTDISIQVPLSNLNKKDGDNKPGNKGLDAKVGPSVYLRAKSKADGKIKVGLDLFRKFRKGGADTTGTK